MDIKTLRFGALAVVLVSVASLAALYVYGTKSDASPETIEEYLGTPAYKSVDRSKPLDEQTSIFEMAGRKFEMPTVYIQTPLGKEREIDGINLLYVLPDYTSRADFPNKQEYEKAHDDRRFAHMLLQPSSKRPSFDVSIANMHHSMEKIERPGHFEGLEIERWFQQRMEGLILYHEVYIERGEDGSVLSWIDCTPQERSPIIRFPSCSHSFRDKELLYKITYNKARYLNDWRVQRASAIAFIDSFEITQNP